MLRQALLGIAVLLAATPVYGQEVNLQWKFKEGDKIWVEEMSTLKTTVSLQNNPVLKSEDKTTSLTSYTIKKVAADSIVMEMKKEEVAARTDNPLLSGMMKKIMDKAKGATFTVTINPAGKVTKFEGYEAFAKDRAKGDDEVAKNIPEFLPEEGFRMEAEEAFSILPDKAVKKGDTWTRSAVYPFSSLGKLKSENTYSLNGQGKDGDEIEVKFKMEYMPPKDAGLGGLFKIVRGDLKPVQKATYVFDPEKGRLVSSTTTMQVRGPLTINSGGAESTIDIALDSSSTLRVYDKKPAR